jgi:hypothetical protein
MATGLLQGASHHGHPSVHAPSDRHGSDAQHGSPLEIFRAFASGLALLAVTGAAMAAVAHLAHLINTSWQLF